MPARLGRAILDYCTETLALYRLRDTSVKMTKLRDTTLHPLEAFASSVLSGHIHHLQTHDTSLQYVSCVHFVGTISRRCFEGTNVFDVVDACLTSLSSESHVPAISEQSCIMRPKFLRLNRKHISLDMINSKSVSRELSIITYRSHLSNSCSPAQELPRSEQL
jgi:hypothetical protein